MPDSALLAALDDALIHQATSSTCPWATTPARAVTRAASRWCVRSSPPLALPSNAAGGNAFSNAYGSNSGQNKPFATDPDTGTSGEPRLLLSPPWPSHSVDNRRPCPCT